MNLRGTKEKHVREREREFKFQSENMATKTPSEILCAEYLENVLLLHHSSVSALEGLVELPAFS